MYCISIVRSSIFIIIIIIIIIIIDTFNPLHAELNPICHLLALLEGHHILHVSRI